MRWPRGPRRYDLAILVELARLRPRRYTLRLDGVPHELDAVLVAVGNCPSYGGGMRICPDADPTDGLLDVVVAGRVDRRTLVRVKPRIYQGTHVSASAGDAATGPAPWSWPPRASSRTPTGNGRWACR